MKEISNRFREDVNLRRSTRHNKIVPARTETQQSSGALKGQESISRALSQMALSDYRPFSKEGTSAQNTPQSDGDTTSEIQNTTRLEFQFQNLTLDIVAAIIRNDTLKSIKSIHLKSSISIIDCSMARRMEKEPETVSKERLLSSLDLIISVVKDQWKNWSDIRKETNKGQELKKILDHFNRQDKLYDEERNRHMNTSEVTDREHTLEPMSEVHTGTGGNAPKRVKQVRFDESQNAFEISSESELEGSSEGALEQKSSFKSAPRRPEAKKNPGKRNSIRALESILNRVPTYKGESSKKILKELAEAKKQGFDAEKAIYRKYVTKRALRVSDEIIDSITEKEKKNTKSRMSMVRGYKSSWRAEVRKGNKLALIPLNLLKKAKNLKEKEKVTIDYNKQGLIREKARERRRRKYED